MNELNTVVEASVAVVKPGKISTLFKAVKGAPVKTTLVVLGTAAVVAGTVYGVKKLRAGKAVEEVTEAELKAEAEAEANA